MGKAETTGPNRRVTVYFIVAALPDGTERRCGPAYSTRKSAQGWVKFVTASFRGSARCRVVSCVLRWRNGELDAESVARLDKFNMDPPSAGGAEEQAEMGVVNAR